MTKLLEQLQRVDWKKVDWKKAAAAATWLLKHAKDLLERNLTPAERAELGRLVSKTRGRRSNLTEKERQRLIALVRKGVTGGTSLSTNTPRLVRRRPASR